MNIADILWDPHAQQLFLAAGLGLVIGAERELAGKDPGLRTFTLISLGSCIFSILSIHSALGVPNAEPSRIAAQILPGIGFIGAGAIFRAQQRIAGLTTAALMWVTASIGMAVGFGQGKLASQATVLTLIIVMALNLGRRILRRARGESGPIPH